MKYFFLGLLIGFIITFTISVLAWQNPTSIPPSGGGYIQTQGSNLIITADKIGIGTPNPKYKLDVNGHINSSILCIKGNCREAWPDSPLSNLNRFVAGHEYPYEDKDPYLRDTSYPYPYLTLKNAIKKFGIDPNNPYATNWFPLAYSYWQPYEQVRSSLFIDEGDNSSPRNLYTKTGPDWEKNNPNDAFWMCTYIDDNGIGRYGFDYNFCYSCAKNPGTVQGCKKVEWIGYADSTSNLKGQVVLQIRLKAWWDQNGKCSHDYLPGMYLGTWGDPKVTNFHINSYQLPDIKNDPCYGVNIHSKIEGRFINIQRCYSDPNPSIRCQGPDPLINFYNAGQNFTYMIKSLGIAYLTWIQ